MSRYINNMAHELEQDIQPAFIAEKEAVSLYAGICGEPRGLYIYREGDHRYSYTASRSKYTQPNIGPMAGVWCRKYTW